MMRAFDDGDGGVGLLRPARWLVGRARCGQRIGSAGGGGDTDAKRGHAEHELTPVDKAMAEIDDRLVASLAFFT